MADDMIEIKAGALGSSAESTGIPRKGRELAVYEVTVKPLHLEAVADSRPDFMTGRRFELLGRILGSAGPLIVSQHFRQRVFAHFFCGLRGCRRGGERCAREQKECGFEEHGDEAGR